MARNAKKAQQKAPQGGGRGGREARATSKKSAPAAAPVAEVEVVEEGKGLGIDDGIVLMTTVVLVIAFFITDYVLGTDYGKGLFFGG